VPFHLTLRAAENMASPESMYPNLIQKLTQTSSGSTVCSYHSDLGKDKPILTLIHGYPQSAFMYVCNFPLAFFD